MKKIDKNLAIQSGDASRQFRHLRINDLWKRGREAAILARKISRLELATIH